MMENLPKVRLYTNGKDGDDNFRLTINGHAIGGVREVVIRDHYQGGHPRLFVEMICAEVTAEVDGAEVVLDLGDLQEAARRKGGTRNSTPGKPTDPAKQHPEA